MNRLSTRILAGFIAAFAVFSVVLATFTIDGYTRSLDVWSRQRHVGIEETVREILLSGADGAPPLPHDVPVFVYNTAGILQYSNRGAGRRRDEETSQLVAVYESGHLIGYFSAPATAFRTDEANRGLLDSLVEAFVVGSIAAIGAACVIAALVSRSLSRPASAVARAIGALASGRSSAPIPEKGTEEIVQITRAANSLSSHLHAERSIRSQWARDIAHDLRTPVASIRAQVEGMDDGVIAADHKQYAMILKEITRITSLIADLDELTKLETPETTIQQREISPQQLCMELTERFAAAVRQKDIAWDCDCSIATMYVDFELLYRAISNIVSNAVRHTPEHGRIVLAVRPHSVAAHAVTAARAVAFSVQNSGPPIAAADLPRIFDRLYRGEYARGSEGSGLGLTIAKTIVELHHGTIAVSSDAQTGTTFTLVIPAGSQNLHRTPT